MNDIGKSIELRFEAAGCAGALHVQDVRSGAAFGVRADESMVAASVFKAIVALEFYIQKHAGQLEASEVIEIDPLRSTPGPIGLSISREPVRLSLDDLAGLMMTISDNAATDVLIGRLGLEKINRRALACGCEATAIVSDLATMLKGVAFEFGFASYRALLEAQAGRLGETARARSTDAAKIDTCAALDPARATRTTARDMTRFLTSVWQGVDDLDARAALRGVMGRQVSRRLESAMPDV